MLRSSLNIENDLTRIGEDCGYSIGEEAGQLRIGVNWGYTATQIWDTLGVGGILAMLAVLILVAFTGYLVIYNIFQISVAGDIRYYGLLKTIGVTPKQLRRLIRQQALLLSVLGIPVGLLLGYGVGAAAVPITMSISTVGGRYTTVSVSPWIFLFSTVFALLTVLLSCALPGGSLLWRRCATLSVSRRGKRTGRAARSRLFRWPPSTWAEIKRRRLS